LGAALFTPVAYAAAAEISPPTMRTRTLSFVVLGLTLANVVGLPVGTAAGALANWRWTFAGIAALAAIAAVAMMRLPMTSKGPALSLKSVGEALANSDFRAVIATSALQYASLFMVFAYIAPIVEQGDALGELGTAWILFLFGCGTIGGNLAGGWAADRWGSELVARLSLLALVPTLVVLPIACSSVIAGSLVATLWGFAGLAFMAPQQRRVIATNAGTPALLLSLNVSAIYLGGSFGALCGGSIERWGSIALGLAAAALALGALAVMLVAQRQLVARSASNIVQG
jgi:MFS transporter, DHA1 family, inner membrane transport protein